MFFDNGKGIGAKSIRRSLSVVAGGNLVGQLLGFLSTFIVIRGILIDDFGKYGVALAFVAIVAQVGDFGINMAFVNLVSGDQKHGFVKFRNATLCIKLFVAFLILLFGVVLSKYIARLLFGSGGEWLLVVYSSFMAAMWVMFAFFQSVHQSQNKFKSMSLIYILTNGIRCLLLGFGVAYGASVGILIFLVGISYLVGIVACIVYTDWNLWSIGFDEFFGLGRVILNVGKWTGLSIVFASATDSAHIIVVQRMCSAAESGIFSGAWQISSVFSLLSGAVATVLLGHMSVVRGPSELRGWLKKSYDLLPWVLFVFLIVVVSVYPVLKVFLGGRYSASYPVLCILLFGFAIALPFNHLWFVFLGVDKPWVLAVSNLFQLLAVLTIDLSIVGYFGSIGAAVSMLVVRLLSVVVLIALISVLIKKMSKTRDDGVVL